MRTSPQRDNCQGVEERLDPLRNPKAIHSGGPTVRSRPAAAPCGTRAARRRSNRGPQRQHKGAERHQGTLRHCQAGSGGLHRAMWGHDDDFPSKSECHGKTLLPHKKLNHPHSWACACDLSSLQGRRSCEYVNSVEMLTQFLMFLVVEYCHITYVDTDIWFWASPVRSSAVHPSPMQDG
eukprot:scaffold2910_cov390-Prasinococcus_capsulatus_cf.AAC.45